MANLYADWQYPERKFEAKYGRGVGPWLTGIVKLATQDVGERGVKNKKIRDRNLKLLRAYLANPETVDKLMEEHEYLASVNVATLREKLQNADSRQFIRSHLAKFLGVRRITPATAHVYYRRIERARAALSTIDDPLARGMLVQLFANAEALLSRGGGNGLLDELFSNQRRTGTTG